MKMHIIIPNVLLVVILLTTLVTLAYFFNPNQNLWWDEAVYLGISKNIFEGNGYWINSEGTESFRPPFFPFLISAVWYITGFSEITARLLPLLFAMLSVLVIYLLAKELFSKEIGLWTALIVGTSHIFLFYSDKILTESIFIFLSTLSLYAFYIAVKNENNFYFMVAGFLMSVSFLTRYAGVLLFSLYVLYPLYLYLRSRKSVYKKWGYWASFLVLFLILIPWFQIGIAYNDSPLGGIQAAAHEVDGRYYHGEWDFYFVNWLNIFGLMGLFAIPGLAGLKKLKNEHVFLLMMIVISIVFFILLPRKEERYLLHFLSLYSMLMSVGIVWAKRHLDKKYIVTAAALVLIGLNLFTGIAMLSASSESGKALKEAGRYLSFHAPEGSKILTNNMPVTHYYSGRETVFFPDTLELLETSINENNVSYILIQIWEPTYPEYVWATEEKVPSAVFNSFSLEKTFFEYGTVNVWVYKV